MRVTKEMCDAYFEYKWNRFLSFCLAFNLDPAEANLDGEERSFEKPSDEWLAGWEAAKECE